MPGIYYTLIHTCVCVSVSLVVTTTQTIEWVKKGTRDTKVFPTISSRTTYCTCLFPTVHSAKVTQDMRLQLLDQA